MNRIDFFRNLGERASTIIDRAVLLAAFAKFIDGRPDLTVTEVAEYFSEAGFSSPNTTRLARSISTDRRLSLRNRRIKPLQSAEIYLRKTIPELFSSSPDDERDVIINDLLLGAVPFIDEKYLADLSKMVRLYEALHVLENSIRKLIEKVLFERLGDEWWTIAASASMKRKHDDRLRNEAQRRWLPARASIGPLYSIDWNDLVTLVRKHQEMFSQFIGDIEFMHRYEELGYLRNVIAHHGFIDDVSEYHRVSLALQDWVRQVKSAL